MTTTASRLCRITLVLAAICPVDAWALPPTGGGAIDPLDFHDRMPAEARAAIERDLEESAARLRAAGTLPEPTLLLNLESLIWPLRAAPGYELEAYHGVSNFVDLNPAFPDQLLDYTCGARTYDLEDGYNHAGIDYFLWPYPWRLMDQGLIEIVAAAPGVILFKHDGNDDRSCGSHVGPLWNAVYVQHTDGSVAWYGHMVDGSLTTKEIGDPVAAGEYLGLVGSSGRSSGPHLHFELHASSAAGSDIIEPHAGACRGGPSLWEDQREYYDTALNGIATHDGPPSMNVPCPNPTQEQPNFADVIALGDPLYVSIYFRDEVPGTDVTTLRLFKPDGSLFQEWTKDAPAQHFTGSWWSWGPWEFLDQADRLGQWRLQVSFRDQVINRHFWYGIEPLTFDPTNLDFGDIAVGSVSAPQTATLHNPAAVDAMDLDFSLPGGDFDVDTSDCGSVLAAGASCEVMATFTPGEPGPAQENLEATSAGGAFGALGLSGNGTDDGFTAMALVVDAAALTSDGNAVVEPGETVEVAPAWRNDDVTAKSLAGTASDFTGPGTVDYSLAADVADYGLVDPGATASCLDTGTCYQLGLGPVGAGRPATHWHGLFVETLAEGAEGNETATQWALHIGDSFTDVQRSSPFYRWVETMLHHEVTGGCGATTYCPAGTNSRGQMPVFVLKALEGPGYTPPACAEGNEAFGDVAHTSPFCPWITELANRGVVAGCGNGNYCPSAAVTRGQMAIFLLKTLEGSGYSPPPCEGLFADVACPSAFAAWIEELAARGITGGCSAEPLKYCPGTPVTRQQMAVFVSRTFGLTLYGP